MKFRHKSNFVPLDLDQIILDLITNNWNSHVNLSQLLACILLKEDVESVLERFDYVKIEE